MIDTAGENPPAAHIKAIYMREKGLKPFGTIFLDPDTGKRATLDNMGRVQWWDVDGSGNMVPNT